MKSEKEIWKKIAEIHGLIEDIKIILNMPEEKYRSIRSWKEALEWVLEK